jgi:uncharacterized protein YndB with AHSA1/START domain
VSGDLVLVVRRTIDASAEFLFDAWTQPEHLRAWWGPRPVRCVDAEVDLRVGGRYRIVNRMPDGSDLVIAGAFTQIERPHRLAYTWSVGETASPELVTVRFDAQGAGRTEVIITHAQIATPKARDSHAMGWEGCLDGLGAFVGAEKNGDRPHFRR